MNYPVEIRISLLSDAVAVVLMIAILIMTHRNRWRGNIESKVFKGLVWNVILDAVFSAASYGMRYQTFPAAESIEITSKFLLEVVSFTLGFFWLMFVDVMLFHSPDHLRRKFKVALIPVVIAIVLLTVNLFTGILYTFDSDLVYSGTWLNGIFEGFQFAYFILAFYVLLDFEKKHGKLHSLNVKPFLIPFLCGMFVTVFLHCTVLALGCAVGIISLFLSLHKRIRFISDENGFYNSEYLEYLKFLAEQGRFSFGSAIVFEDINCSGEMGNLLRNELPDGAELIHVSGGEYLMITELSKRSRLKMLCELVGDAVAEFNAEHKNNMIALKTKFRIRRGEEGLAGFLEELKAQSREED